MFEEELALHFVPLGKCGIRFNFTTLMREDKQRRRNHRFIEWLLENHSLTFKNLECIDQGSYYIVELEPTMNNWAIAKLNELQTYHNFVYEIGRKPSDTIFFQHGCCW